MVYDVTMPTAPKFITYTVNRTAPTATAATDDRGPEGILYIAPADSPNGQGLLLLANEVSNSVSVYQVNAPVTALALTAPTYDYASGAFRFNTTGGDGSQIEYRAVPGITDWTTNPNQFVDRETRTAADAPVILLQARQNGQIVTLDFNIRAVCLVGTRIGVDFAESEVPLRVRILGNPTQSETIVVDVRGAESKPLRLTVRDMQGRTVSEESVKQAEAVERHTLSLGRTPGMYLLQINTPTQSRTLKVVRQ